MTSTSYRDALGLVMSLPDFERAKRDPSHHEYHLERIRALLSRLGDPHLDVPTIHVAGTKGKGSTAAMVTSVLTAAGHKTGLYTSPHLHSVVERIRVGLDPISRDDFVALVEQIWPSVEHENSDGKYGKITFFELMTAMAFLHFALVKADFQVIEVGLGGRLDATNVVVPELCILTRISLDHESILGDTIEKIAGEKAGIIKPAVPAVVAPQLDEALGVFKEVCRQRLSPLIDVAKDLAWSDRRVTDSGQGFRVESHRQAYDVETPLMGRHQVDNVRTAVAALEALAASGHEVSSKDVLDGLAGVSWPARMQVLDYEGRRIVVDGAHNPDSAGRLAEALREHFDFDGVILIFGATGGHSAGGMLAELAELSPIVVPVQSRHPRSSRTQTISEEARALGMQVEEQTDSVATATRAASELAEEKDLIVGTGSLSVAAEVIEVVCGMEPELYPEMDRPADAKLQ